MLNVLVYVLSILVSSISNEIKATVTYWLRVGCGSGRERWRGDEAERTWLQLIGCALAAHGVLFQTNGHWKLRGRNDADIQNEVQTELVGV